MSTEVSRAVSASPTMSGSSAGRHAAMLTPSRSQPRGSYTPIDFVGMYNFEGTIGTGQHSVVKLATHVLSKNKVAVKVIDKSKLDKVELQHMSHEVRVMKMLRHPHVIRLYEIVETANWFYLVLELASEGDLYEHIQKHGPFGEEAAKHVFAQLVLALSYCHEHRVAHRDLKPENVVLCKDRLNGGRIVKVTDFGLSNMFNQDSMMDTFCGSMAYSSPEVLLQEPYDGPMSDMWSLGVILYMMVCKTHPFRQANEHETLIKVMDVAYDFPSHVSPEFCNLVQIILKKEPKERATLNEIRHHPWLTNLEGQSIVDEWSERERSWYGTQSLSGKASSFKLSPGEHEQVVAELEESNISRAEIEQALAEETFDYVSSTYCLVAEEHFFRRNSVENAGNNRQGSKRTHQSFSNGSDTMYFEEQRIPSTPEPLAQRSDSGTQHPTSCPRNNNLRQRPRRPGTTISNSASGGDTEVGQLSENLAFLALSPRTTFAAHTRSNVEGHQLTISSTGVDLDGADGLEVTKSMFATSMDRFRQESDSSAEGIIPDPLPDKANDYLQSTVEMVTSTTFDYYGPGSPLSKSARFSDLRQLDELEEEEEPEEE